MSAGSMAAQVRPLWSQKKVERELGVTTHELLELTRDRRLLGLMTSDGVLLFPVSQFERVGGAVRVRPAVQQMISILDAHDAWTVAQLLHTPVHELGGLSPVQAAREDVNLDDAFDYIRWVNSDWLL
jgi:hypothetical protein